LRLQRMYIMNIIKVNIIFITKPPQFVFFANMPQYVKEPYIKGIWIG
jgi:hypothetical protein